MVSVQMLAMITRSIMYVYEMENFFKACEDLSKASTVCFCRYVFGLCILPLW